MGCNSSYLHGKAKQGKQLQGGLDNPEQGLSTEASRNQDLHQHHKCTSSPRLNAAPNCPSGPSPPEDSSDLRKCLSTGDLQAPGKGLFTVSYNGAVLTGQRGHSTTQKGQQRQQPGEGRLAGGNKGGYPSNSADPRIVLMRNGLGVPLDTILEVNSEEQHSLYRHSNGFGSPRDDA